ncbi:MAG: hypothetical protein GQ582_04690 [Methyloprofundus sp.]|nr:hypothetical protein [Methyloprofundus sp.]
MNNILLSPLSKKSQLTEQEVRQLQLQVQKQQQVIRDLNKELDSFTYSVSHDLKGPLTIMNGFVEMLLRDYREELGERGARLLNRVYSNAGYLTDSIDGLLRLSRVSGADITLSHIDVTATVTELVQQLTLAHPQREVTVVIATDMQVYSDAELLQEVLQELLANAWKFTQYQSVARIEISQIEHAGQFVLQIKDNGVGFDKALMEQLFIPLRRLHSSEEFSGKGLGLALVYKMLQRLGGEITIESASSEGCCFQLVLPLDTDV